MTRRYSILILCLCLPPLAYAEDHSAGEAAPTEAMPRFEDAIPAAKPGEEAPGRPEAPGEPKVGHSFKKLDALNGKWKTKCFPISDSFGKPKGSYQLSQHVTGEGSSRNMRNEITYYDDPQCTNGSTTLRNWDYKLTLQGDKIIVSAVGIAANPIVPLDLPSSSSMNFQNDLYYKQ